MNFVARVLISVLVLETLFVYTEQSSCKPPARRRSRKVNIFKEKFARDCKEKLGNNLELDEGLNEESSSEEYSYRTVNKKLSCSDVLERAVKCWTEGPATDDDKGSCNVQDVLSTSNFTKVNCVLRNHPTRVIAYFSDDEDALNKEEKTEDSRYDLEEEEYMDFFDRFLN